MRNHHQIKLQNSVREKGWCWRRRSWGSTSFWTVFCWHFDSHSFFSHSSVFLVHVFLYFVVFFFFFFSLLFIFLLYIKLSFRNFFPPPHKFSFPVFLFFLLKKFRVPFKIFSKSRKHMPPRFTGFIFCSKMIFFCGRERGDSQGKKRWKFRWASDPGNFKLLGFFAVSRRTRTGPRRGQIPGSSGRPVHLLENFLLLDKSKWEHPVTVYPCGFLAFNTQNEKRPSKLNSQQFFFPLSSKERQEHGSLFRVSPSGLMYGTGRQLRQIGQLDIQEGKNITGDATKTDNRQIKTQERRWTGANEVQGKLLV